jgi:hypothetical protein
LGNSANNVPDFDPLVAAEVLEWMAELATQGQAERLLQSDAPVVRAAFALLADARTWLEAYRGFPGESILRTVSRGRPVYVDSLVAALREAANELAHVQQVLEWRLLRESVAAPASAR